MDVQFLGATDNHVTGSRNLLTFPDGLKVLVDFGLTQTNDGSFEETLNWNGRDFEFDIDEISYVVLTHSHIDHIGLLPLLISRGFKGKIIATAPTGEFAAIALPDSAKIMEGDIFRRNKYRPKNKLIPLYTKEDAENTISRIQCYDYNTEIILSDSVSLKLKNAGHMLGATMPLFTFEEEGRKRTLLFTGDTSGKSIRHPFLKPADDIGEVNYIVCESTYGDRKHEINDPLEILRKSIQETCIDRGKTLVVPVFSMQRSSEILWLLREVYNENEKFNRIPIFLDSPMAIKSQEVIKNNKSFWGDKWINVEKGIGSLFDWDVIQYIENYKESQALANGFPKIILSSSGMCNAGRILNHLVSFLSSKGCKVLFTGYLAEGTLARKIIETKHKSIAVNRNQVTMRAEIEQMSFSSHADMNDLLTLLKTSKRGKLKRVFLNHGSENAKENLRKEIERHLKVEVEIPQYKETFTLK